MEERRGASRAKVNQLFNVVDRNHGRVLGNLVDISAQGLLIFGKEPVAVDTVWQLCIELPLAIDGATTIRCGAESLWTDAIGEPPVFWTGFHIIDLAEVERQRILLLIEQQSDQAVT